MQLKKKGYAPNINEKIEKIENFGHEVPEPAPYTTILVAYYILIDHR